MTETLKIGVIGCGSISRRHMEASTRLEHVEITAASSRASTSLDEVSGDYGISNLFTDWRELVSATPLTPFSFACLTVFTRKRR
jgi:predicted dehydrogenase